MDASMKEGLRIPQVTLANGSLMPQLGLGTWKLYGKDCVAAVQHALKAGYRHIDTAERYENQSDIGMAIKGFPRKSLFITTKVWYDRLAYDDLMAMCEAALEELRTRYIDLYLVHWPNEDIPLKGTMEALNDLYDKQKIHAIGVSNFGIRHLKKAMKQSAAPICNNQVETHPFWHDERLLDFCQENEIAVTAYSPLAQGLVFKDKTIKGIAERNRRTVSQVVLRWLAQKGCVVIPKATSRAMLLENAGTFGFHLSTHDMALMDTLAQGKRLVDPPWADWS
jgi:diketogulonate reductase-like aldo/keto reductase